LRLDSLISFRNLQSQIEWSSQERNVSDFGSVLDEMIRDAMKSGKFSNLPGEGKPLQLEDDGHVPEQLRMAHKLLRDNDLAPDWIIDGKQLEAMREQMLKTLRRDARAYHAAGIENAGARTGWFRAQATFRETAIAFNRKVLNYNLKVPQGVTHQTPLNIEGEIRRASENI
jgi:hypothetical protein